MFLRVMAVLLGLVGLAGVGLALIGLQQQPATPAQAAVTSAAPSAPVVQRSILAAARAQHAGNLMVADDVTAIQVVPGAEPPGSFIDSVANRTALRGAM